MATAAPPAATQDASVPCTSLRMRPFQESAAREFKIVYNETDLTITGENAKSYKMPWSSVSAVAMRIQAFGNSSIFLEFNRGKDKAAMRFLYATFPNKYAADIERGALCFIGVSHQQLAVILTKVRQQARKQAVPEWLYTPVIGDIGLHKFYSQTLRLIVSFVLVAMKVAAFVGVATTFIHMIGGIITANPTPITNPALDALRNRVQRPVENFISHVIWPYAKAHYIIATLVCIAGSVFIFPFIGVYLLLALLWTVAFHASFLVFYGALLRDLGNELLRAIPTGLAIASDFRLWAWSLLNRWKAKKD